MKILEQMRYDNVAISNKRQKLAARLRGSRPGGAIHIAHYDVIDDVITRKL